MKNLITKRSVPLLVCLSFLLLSKQTFPAAFSLPTSLINIPIAQQFKPGDLEFGTSVGYNSTQAYEFDYKLFYCPSDKIKLGVTLLNYHQVVSSLHVNFFQIPRLWNLRVGAGLLYITSDKTLSTWEEYNTSKANNFSNYLVGSMDTPWGIYHLGFGKKRFESTSSSDSLGGLFFGTEYALNSGKAMAEYDGTDINIGFQFPIGDTTQINVAGTQLTRDSNSDEGTPKEYASVGLSFIQNMNPPAPQSQIKEAPDNKLIQLQKNNAALQKQLNDLQAAYRTLKETTDLKEKAEEAKIVVAPPIPAPPVEIPEKKVISPEKQTEALQLFSIAQDNISVENFVKAIEKLSQAIETDPSVSDYYLQRGYLFYRKGILNKKDADWALVQQYLLKKAKADWDKARELNPRDPALLRLPIL